MALSNLFGWKKSETEAGSACGAANQRRNRQHAEQHVEHLTSKIS